MNAHSAKFFLLILLFWAECAGVPALLGQKRVPEPEPPVSASGSDTLQAHSRKQKMELPDVLVLGTSRERRTPKTKRAPVRSPAPPASVLNRTPLPPQQPDVALAAAVPSLQAVSRPTATSAGFRFGGFNTAELAFRHWQRQKDVEFSVAGQYGSSDGAYPNSQYERWRLGTEVQYHLAGGNVLRTGVEYRSNHYGLWGTPARIRRKLEQLQGSFGLTSFRSGKISYGLEVRTYRLPLRSAMDRISANRLLDNTQEKGFVASGRGSLSAGVWRIGGRAEYLSVTEKKPPLLDALAASPVSSSLRLATVRLTAERLLGAQGVFRFGLKWQSAALPGGKKQRLFPVFALNYSLNSKTQLRLRYTGELRLLTLKNLSRSNPFLDFKLPADALEEHRQKITLGLAQQLSRDLTVKVTYQYGTAANFHYWSRMDSSAGGPAGLFALRPADKVHLAFLRAEVIWGTLTPLRVRARLQISGSGIDRLPDSGRPVLHKKIPYFEDVGLPVFVDYRVRKNLTLHGEFFYAGDRFASPYELKSLKSIWLLNGELSYRLRFVEISLGARNILNQKAEIWQGYPVPGLQLFLGVTSRF